MDCTSCMIYFPFFSRITQADIPGTIVAPGMLGFLEGLSKRKTCMYSCMLDKQEFSYLNIDFMTSSKVLNLSSDNYLKKLNLSYIGEGGDESYYYIIFQILFSYGLFLVFYFCYILTLFTGKFDKCINL